MLNPYEVMYDARMTVQRWREVEKGGYVRNELFTVGRISSAATALRGRLLSALQTRPSKTVTRYFVVWKQMCRRAIGLL